DSTRGNFASDRAAPAADWRAGPDLHHAAVP
ncbi:MAG: hypothetical protein AVDCRST_MAG18-4205, partial [uncultured Thermomicrobiales bacterium]